MYSFKRLIRKYSKFPVYEIFETEGFRDPDKGGIYIPGKTEEILLKEGAVVPLNKDELHYGEGGTYASNDRKLYCYSKLEKGTKVRHKEKDYTIHENMDYGDFDDGLVIYMIKRGG